MEHLMVPSAPRGSRKQPQQTISTRRSTASLRQPEPFDHLSGPASAAGRFSLAHELAAALMPEPSAGSRLLSEEFGIEFDEGAEGIDPDPEEDQMYQSSNAADDHFGSTDGHSTLGDELSAQSFSGGANARSRSMSIVTDPQETSNDDDDEYEATFGSGNGHGGGAVLSGGFGNVIQSPPPQDPLEVLSQNLEATGLFLTRLRHLDVDPSQSSDAQPHSSAAHEPTLERLAAGIIRRINDIARERESQVRELMEYEREFRKLSAEVGGDDVLGALDELECVEDLLDSSERVKVEEDLGGVHATPRSSRHTSLVADGQGHSWGQSRSHRGRLDQLDEEEEDLQYEQDLLGGRLGDDEEDDEYGLPSPTRNRNDSIPPMLPLPYPATASGAIPHLAQMRTVTQSLVQSLTSISEQAQVSGSAAADAGRKIRALKTKIGGWRSDWESAEKSRLKIERWEAGEVDDLTSLEVNLEVDDESPGLSLSSSPSSRETSPTPATPEISPTRRAPAFKRIDGRKLAEEQLLAFELVLAEVDIKTKAIMARRT